MRTILGKYRDTRNVLAVSDLDRQSGMYLLGVQGVGKSSLLELLIDQDISKGYSVIVIDPHGDLIEHVIGQMGVDRLVDTFVLDIEDVNFPFGLNLLTAPRGASITQLAEAKNRLLHVFERTFPDTSRMLLEKYLGNIAPVFFANPGFTLAEVPLFLRDSDFRSRLLGNVNNIFIRDFWEQEYESLSPSRKQTETASLSTRLNRFVRSEIIGNIIGQSQTTIDFRKAIENKEIILIRLPVKRLPEESSFIGTMLVAQIHAAIFSFADMRLEDRPGFSLYVDEFQHFATPDFAEMFSEGRKFGSRVCIAHQFREQIPDFLKKGTLTARTIVTFQTTVDDAPTMAGVYESEELELQKEDIEPSVVKHLLSFGHEHPVIEYFIKQYLRQVQTAQKSKGLLVVNGNDGEGVPDPMIDLNALLYEVEKKGDWTLPIPIKVLWGFSSCGAGYYPAIAAIPDQKKVFLATTTDLVHLKQNVRVSVSFGLWLVNHLDIIWGIIFLPLLFLWIARWVEESKTDQLANFLLTLRHVMQILASDPIGEKKSRTRGDIAREIGSLPRRQAYVKAGDEISVVETINTPRIVAAYELSRRKADMQRRTRRKYGKPASFVIREILERQKRRVMNEEDNESVSTAQETRENGLYEPRRRSRYVEREEDE